MEGLHKKRIFKNILANEIGKNIISNYPWATKITELCHLGGGIVEKQIFNSSKQLIFGSVVTPSKEEIISYTQNNNRLRVGDVLISKLKGYHYVCIKVDGNEAKLLWIERKSGQPTGFYKYTRFINISTFLANHALIPVEKVNRNVYKEPISG